MREIKDELSSYLLIHVNGDFDAWRAHAQSFKRDLLIVISEKREISTLPNYKSDWSKACRSMSEGFKDLGRSGTTGIFSRVICEGNVIKTPIKDFLKTTRESWVLHIGNDADKVSFAIYHRSMKGFDLEAEYTLSRMAEVIPGGVVADAISSKKSGDRLFEALRDPNMIRYLSLILQDQLPVLAVVRFRKNGRHTFNLDPNVIKPDTVDLTVFDLKFNNNIFEPQVVGQIKDGGGRWIYDLKKGGYSFDKPYFVQASKGRLQHQTRLNSLLDNAVNKYGFGSFLDGLLSSLDSSFAGIRIGLPPERR